MESELESLRRENRSLARQVEDLRAARGEAEQRGAAAAWEEAEALLAELVMDHADEALVEASSKVLDGAGPPDAFRRGHLSLTGEDSRQKLLAIRDAVRQRDRRMEELRRQKEELLSIVAHDLRTPLVAVQGFLQLLRLSGESASLSAKQQEYLHRIAQAVRAMNGLVEDLLTARKLEQRRLPLRPRPVEVKRFLEELLAIHAEGARQKEVAVTLKCPTDLPGAVFDPDRLGQAIGNLIQNAVRFTPSGGTVHVAATDRRGELCFEVEDEGPGVPEHLLSGLFDRTAQSQISDAVGRGTGLGLAICGDIVRLHGGSVDAENLPDKGCRFRLHLPRSKIAQGKEA